MKIAQGKLVTPVYWGILSSHFFSGPGTPLSELEPGCAGLKPPVASEIRLVAKRKLKRVQIFETGADFRVLPDPQLISETRSDFSLTVHTC